ncbi:hypothetical protein A6E15_05355 [Natrinema saccharevitans]|uniref:DUF1616 domain-containing protein n=1 Tax=Natrinema saccharevitans TaxID=301967 RepID=A0A1S8B1Y6_9EURY|nr:DUF1616 domain-containing protein [Natrinema saccharevitans]OLZ42634.1 hypothetical protein A6E15_05355 [Natrinema saccharevitans]
MSHRTSTWTRFGIVRRYPFDLAAVSVGAVVAYLLVTGESGNEVLRLLATLPLALFLPGYGLGAVLFPAAKREDRETAATAADARPRGIDAVERIGLAFVLSLTIAPLVVLVLPITSWGLTTASVSAGLAGLAVCLAQLGVVRRLRTPASQRFTVSPLAGLERLRRNGRGAATVSTVVLVVAIGTAVGALLVGVLVPVSGGGFTELALYSENEDGEVVAGALPEEVEAGEAIPTVVEIENGEGEERAYTTVVQQQVLEDGAVVERTQLERTETTVPAGETENGERSVTPTADPGETVRISVLLYEDEPPSTPTNENAAESTHFWVTVTDG